MTSIVCCISAAAVKGWFAKRMASGVGEKWFFLDKVSNRVHLTQVEAEKGLKPRKKARHKSHIVKVMFLCAIARPRFADDGSALFDGKIGIWPFVEQVAAQRSSVNHPRGTLETKCVSAVKEVHLKMMVEKMLPAINSKWPRSHEPVISITIQQDGPPVHRIHNENRCGRTPAKL